MSTEKVKGANEFAGQHDRNGEDAPNLVVEQRWAVQRPPNMAGLGEDPEAILAIGPFTAPFDVCGYPTITLPCGASALGSPIGFQLVAKPFAENLLCRAGHAYQTRTAWHLRRPDLDRFDNQGDSAR